MDDEATEQFLVLLGGEGLLDLRLELLDHFEVLRQIGRQDVLDEHLPEFAEVLLIDVDQDVAFVLLDDFDGCGCMVLFENAFIVVSYGQFRQTVYFKDIGPSSVIYIMA